MDNNDEKAVYEQINAAIDNDEAERDQIPLERRHIKNDWRKALTVAFMESLQNMQSRLNGLKYQAKVAPEFLFQLEMPVPSQPHLVMVCTLEYHERYQFAAGLDPDKDIMADLYIQNVYEHILTDWPMLLSTFDAAVKDCKENGTLYDPRFDSVQNRTIYKLNKYGGLVVVVFGIMNKEKYPDEVTPDFPKMFLWKDFDEGNCKKKF